MDERCRRAHAKLLAGTCPWCGQPIFKCLSPTQTTASESLLSPPPPSAVSLRELVLRDGPLGAKTAAQYIEAVAKQLQQIHSSGALHRGVQPDHIFVDDAGVARLVAFQQFSATGLDASSISADVERETLAIVDFLAPEAVQQSHRNDVRCDIYSLGCTMYFLLAGRPPFPDGSISERLLKHHTATPVAIQSLRPDLPVALASICETMMAKKPGERYQTAKEVGDAIAAWHAEGGD